MNSAPHDPMQHSAAAGPDTSAASVDATLRLMATLPVPEGLEDRIHSKLRSAPRTGRLLFWPAAIDSSWMRGAAAAAIVVIVAGGGWGVYSRVDRPQPAKVIMLPAAGPASGGFSSAGAMRTPTTLNAPVLKHPAKMPAAKVKHRQTAKAGPRVVQSTAVNPGASIAAPAAR